MGRVLFGKRAIKKEKSETEDVVYLAGSLVLGVFYTEKPDCLKFKMPNGRLGVVYKKLIANDIEKDDEIDGLKKLVKIFRKDMYVELLVLGAKPSEYECTIFTQKNIKVNSIVTGIIEEKEEIGYTVALGVLGKTALLKTSTNYTEGMLDVFQVGAVTPSTYFLHNKLDREIYLREKDEISPGILVRTTVIGRPKYILGEIRPKYTNMYYSYTVQSMTLGDLVIESKKELEEDAQQLSIIVYVSEDRSIVHAVPYDEYIEEIHKSLPDPEALIGKVCVGEVVTINSNGYSTVKLEDGFLAILYQEHYSDISRKGSNAPFKEGDAITVRIFDVKGYSVTVTAKESFINEKPVHVPLKVGDATVVSVVAANDHYIKCTTFGRSLVYIRRAKETPSDTGAVHRVRISKLGNEKGVFKGTLLTPEMETRKREEDKENILQKNVKKARKTHKKLTLEEQNAEKLKNIKRFTNGQIVAAKITNIYQYGAFARIAPYLMARIKIGEISSRYVQEWATLIHLNQKIKIVLYDIDYESGKVEGSIKKYEVLNSMESAPSEPAQIDMTEHQEPIAYGVEEEQIETETEDSESEDEDMLQMELFNCKDGVEPWSKRMQNMPPQSLLKTFNRAMEYLQSPEAKKKICLIYATSLANYSSETIDAKYLLPVDEGVQRDGSVFLKKLIDSIRTAKNREFYRYVCHRFIKCRKDSPFGYRELITAARADNRLDVLRDVGELLEKSDLKQTEKKTVEALHIEALYSLAKNEARAAIEKKLACAENKNKEEWTMRYISLETGNISKNADIIYARNMLNKLVNSKDLTEEAVKSIFKSFLKFEKDYGTKDREEAVLRMAKEYVSKTVE